MNLNSSNEITLNNGISIPSIGLGTWRVKGDLVKQSVKTAIQLGYKHIDTAAVYKNETEIGNELFSELKISRNNIFITSKLPPSHQNYEASQKSIKNSLSNLLIDYLDLYLIHWPGTAKTPIDSIKNKENRIETWHSLEQMYRDHQSRSIGVSNFTIKHLKEILEIGEIKPMINQCEFHPHLFQKELLEFCLDNNIVFEAYSPLGTGAIIDDISVQKIAHQYQRSPAQVLLRWGQQHGAVVLPRSSNSKRIAENIEGIDFDLDDEDMDILDGLDQQKHYCWNPETIY